MYQMHSKPKRVILQQIIITVNLTTVQNYWHEKKQQRRMTSSLKFKSFKSFRWADSLHFLLFFLCNTVLYFVKTNQYEPWVSPLLVTSQPTEKPSASAKKYSHAATTSQTASVLASFQMFFFCFVFFILSFPYFNVCKTFCFCQFTR